MRRFLSAVALGATLLISRYALAEAPVPVAPTKQPPMAVQMIDPMDHLRQATLSIGIVGTVSGKNSYITKGSSVLVASDASHACLLTAKHMFSIQRRAGLQRECNYVRLRP